MPTLSAPLRLGSISCPNRVLMAPVTRTRGTRNHVPTKLMATYYAQRASAGLIISEAIGISQQGLGLAFATGIWNEEQVEGWRRITDAVHAEGGRIVAQVWHMGRMVHPDFCSGALPVSASPTCAPGRAHTYAGRQPYVAARQLDPGEIFDTILPEYRHAARNARRAGFDGVQVHAANGYLIDQFLRDSSNLRNDAYGGPVANRLRLLQEVTQAVVEEVGADRTSVRLSPNGPIQGVNDSDPEPLFCAAGAMLDRLGIAFLELREPPRDGTLGQADHDPIAPAIRNSFRGPLVLNSDITPGEAVRLVGLGLADAVSFGRLFVSNPDLPYRLQTGQRLAP